MPDVLFLLRSVSLLHHTGYSNNGEAAYVDGKWKVPAASATFLKVEN